MGKKKDSVALFEVISKNRQARQPEQGLHVPGWMGPEDEQDAAPEPPGPQADAGVQAQAQSPEPPPLPKAGAKPGQGGVVSAAAARHRASVSRSPYAASPPEPTFGRVGDRIRLNMTGSMAVVTLVGLVGLLILAFLVGRWTASPGGEPADSGAAQAGVGDTPEPGDGGGEPQAGIPKPIPGKYYLVIQGGIQRKADARRIRAWCNSHGHAAQAYPPRSGGGGYYVVSMEKAFDTPSGPDQRALAREIERMGEEYAQYARERSGVGIYRFQQRRSRNAELTPKAEMLRRPS